MKLGLAALEPAVVLRIFILAAKFVENDSTLLNKYLRRGTRDGYTGDNERCDRLFANG